MSNTDLTPADGEQQDTTPETGPQPAAQPDPEPEPAAEAPETPEAGQDAPQDGRHAELAALAAEVDAAIEEAARQVDASLQLTSETEAAFLLRADADIATARQDCADYAKVAGQRINGLLDEATAIIGALVSQHRRAA